MKILHRTHFLMLLIAVLSSQLSARTHIREILFKGGTWTLDVDGETGTLKLLGGSGSVTSDNGWEMSFEVDWNGRPGNLYAVMDGDNREQRVELKLTRGGVQVVCKGFIARETSEFMAGTTSYAARPRPIEGAWYALSMDQDQAAPTRSDPKKPSGKNLREHSLKKTLNRLPFR